MLLLTLALRLNTRRFVHGRGTDREEATIPTFVMVAHTLPASVYPQREREVQFEEDVEQQKVSVAPDSDKVKSFRLCAYLHSPLMLT